MPGIQSVAISDGERGNIMDLLHELFGGLNRGFVTLSTAETGKKGMCHRWYDLTDPKSIKQLKDEGHQADQRGLEAYFSTCPGDRLGKHTKTRIRQQDALLIPAVFMDVDTHPSGINKGNKDKTIPKSPEEALSIFNALPLPPSVTINSGHGLHAYWLLKKPIEITDNAAANTILKTFANAVGAYTKFTGWDGCSELARILRIPGTHNHKAAPPLPVMQNESSWARYDINTLQEFTRLYLPLQEPEIPQATRSLPASFSVKRQLDKALKDDEFKFYFNLEPVSDGDKSRNNSDDDAKLMWRLAYWMNKDRAAMREGFQASARSHRKKAFREDYIQQTINYAIETQPRTAEEDNQEYLKRRQNKNIAKKGAPSVINEIDTQTQEPLTHDQGAHDADQNQSNDTEIPDFILAKPLAIDKNGNPVKTIENFMRILEGDPKYNDVRFNLLTKAPETIHNDKLRRWTDADDAISRHYIETNYWGLYHKEKHEAALRVLWNNREYHPIRNIVNDLVWDKKPRIEEFLIKWMGAVDDAYSREVSRLIFAGGIHRLYNPGCKFDIMPVLIGTNQGEGKSTIVRWLAMNDEYYGEMLDIETQKGIEQLSGVWIAEMGELLAISKAREVEAVKAYITRMVDRYRAPYDRFINDHPRQCIFIGTTNNRQFLSDKSGNRRFFPVIVSSSGNHIFKNEKIIKEEIKQCWAEAKVKMDNGTLLPYENYAIMDEIKTAQENAMFDDWREGKIAAYLETQPVGTKICAWELRHRALYPTDDKLRDDKVEARQIGIFMDKAHGWTQCKVKTRPTNAKELGPQRCWEKLDSFVNVDENDVLPFL